MLEIEDDKVEPGTIIQEIQFALCLVRDHRPSFVGISKKKIQKTRKRLET